MKIAISTNGKEAGDLTDPRFGRCAFFAIYDTEQEAYRFIENKAQSSGGGAGIAAAQQLIDEDVEVILTGNMGPNAYNVMVNTGMKAYRVGSVPLNKAIELFKEAKLEAISEAGSAHYGMRRGFRGGQNQ